MSLYDVETIDLFKGKYAFLSNFFRKKLEYQGKEYDSAEHLYQAFKATNDEDHEFIRLQPTPAKAKEAGKKITRHSNWDDIKLSKMLLVLRIKFLDPELREMLKATGDAELIEGNWWGDRYWGVCRGKGKNMLGKLLMVVRNEI